jgi:hypothetical protein
MRATATITPTPADDYGPAGWRVTTTWDADVDRPTTGGYILTNHATARRLVAAINAQAVYTDPRIVTDVNGATYVQATSRVLGRRASADLRRLGY